VSTATSTEDGNDPEEDLIGREVLAAQLPEAARTATASVAPVHVAKRKRNRSGRCPKE
jgi:hypothetical protein